MSGRNVLDTCQQWTVGGHHLLRLDHVVGVHALRRLYAVKLATERSAHQRGSVHGLLR